MNPTERASGTVDHLLGVVDSLADRVDSTDGDAGRLDGALDEIQALSTALEHADNVEDVVDEVGDLSETIDVLDLLTTLDWESLPDTVGASDLPVVDDGEGEGDDAHLDARPLVDPEDVWPHVDVREAWRQLRDLEAELEALVGGSDSDGNGDGAGDDTDDVLPDGPSVSLVEGSDLHGETAENAIQAGVSDAVGEFREGLLALHDRLEALYESNRKEAESRRSNRSNSRNPTAVSTMPRSGLGRNAVRHSTVPEETRYSTAPNRRRIYGGRFDDATGDGDE